MVINDTECKCLKDNIDKALEAGMSSLPNETEPVIVEAIFKTLPQAIYDSLAGNAGGAKIEVYSVFAHKSPLVTYSKDGNKNGCELGDLLIAYVQRYNENTNCNALLLQAKKTPVEENKVQKYLYENWPQFEMRKAKAWGITKADIYPKAVSQGAMYLLVSSKGGKFEFDVDTVAGVPNASTPFSEQLVNLVKFVSGRSFSFDENVPNKDDWSKLMSALIRNSLNVKYNLKASGAKDKSRQNAIEYQVFGNGESGVEGDIIEPSNQIMFTEELLMSTILIVADVKG